MEIATESYNVFYADNIISMEGSLRLNGLEEYASISDLLNNIIVQEPETITLNLKELSFLNSSGISMLSKFVINVRKKQNIQMVVIGSSKNPWQAKSLKNLQRLMPSLTLNIA